jgi:nitroreductase
MEGDMPNGSAQTLSSSVLKIIKERYSCRRYSSEIVQEEVIDLLKEAVTWAPSACNRQPYTFHFIDDPEIIEEISKAVPMGPASVNKWISSAPLLVAGVGKPEMIWHKLTQMIDTDYHRTDVAIAMDHLSLVAAELGLGSCWIGWFHRKKVGKILKVSRGEEVVMLMTVGHPDRDPPRSRQRKTPEELFR